jgi:1,4-alpha-glucan branching enzyme
MMYWHHGHDMPFDRDKYFLRGVEFDAITYLQLANKLIHSYKKGAISIAEDVTGMPGLCHPQHEGGIGFDYRLGMGIPDFWIRLLKEQPDETWDIYQMYQTMLDRRFDIKTVAYAESHDQALVGDKTIAFWLMDKEMYFSMGVTDMNPVVDRGVALHKMIRLFTAALGGNAYMNFMGNEFGHPEWIDFPRQGNNWSYFYARRQWSLADHPGLRYQYLARWDKIMLSLLNDFELLNAPYPNLLNNDDWNKTLCFERGGLIFVFNFHVNHSVADYRLPVPEPGKYELILNSDDRVYGGFGRIDEQVLYFTQPDETGLLHQLSIYNVNRAVQVFRKKS